MSVGGVADRYVARRFVAVYGLCLLGFLLLFLVVDGMARLDDFLELRGADLGEPVWRVAVQYYASRIPALAVVFAPYLSLFAAIACLMSFTRHNEFVPMIMAGRSLHRVLLPVYAAAVLVTGVLIVAEEALVPRALRFHETVAAKLDPGELRDGEAVPHLRDGDNVIVADRWFKGELRLSLVRSLDFVDPTGALPEGELRVYQLRYRRHDGRTGWFPRGGELIPREPLPDGRTQDAIRLPQDRPLPISLTPTEVEVLVETDRASLSRAKLLELRRLYPEKHELSMQLYSRSSRPMSSIVLLLLGLPFVARPGQRSVAAGLAVALGCCAAYVGVDLFFQELGNRGDLNALVAAWFAPLLYFAIAVSRLDRVVT